MFSLCTDRTKMYIYKSINFLLLFLSYRRWYHCFHKAASAPPYSKRTVIIALLYFTPKTHQAMLSRNRGNSSRVMSATPSIQTTFCCCSTTATSAHACGWVIQQLEAKIHDGRLGIVDFPQMFFIAFPFTQSSLKTVPT